MNEQMRQGFGLLAVAVVGLVVALLGASSDGDAGEVMRGVGLLVALVCGVIGLAFIAINLLRRPQSD